VDIDDFFTSGFGRLEVVDKGVLEDDASGVVGRECVVIG
jgi:hypothetical protein